MTITFGELESIDTAAQTNLGLLLRVDSAARRVTTVVSTDGFVETELLLALDARSTALSVGTADVDQGFVLSLDALGYLPVPLVVTNFEAELDMLLALEAEADQQSFEEPIPSEPANAAVDFVLYADAVLSPISHMLADVDTEFLLSVEGLPANYAEVEFQLSVSATQDLVPLAYAFLVERPTEIYGYADTFFEQYASTVEATSTFDSQVALLFNSVATLSAGADWLASLEMTLRDSVLARAVFTVLMETSFTDTALASAQLDALPRVLLSLADQLVALDEVANYENALIMLASALAASDKAVYGTDLSVESLTDASDEFSSLFTALLALADEVDAADEATVGGGFTLLLADAAQVLSEFDGSVNALIELLDTATVTARFNLPGADGGLYVGYAMNLRTGGMVRYENYPFVDFATVGSLSLAVAEDGLYLLEGDDDAGEPIRSRIRTGMSGFGTDMLKHNPNAYVGYTSDGALLLKVLTSDGGRKKANYYQLRPRQTPAPTSDRFDIAKGLTGVYWGYQIENIDGADFELDTIKVWPFVVQRRKSGR